MMTTTLKRGVLWSSAHLAHQEDHRQALPGPLGVPKITPPALITLAVLLPSLPRFEPPRTAVVQPGTADTA